MLHGMLTATAVQNTYLTGCAMRTKPTERAAGRPDLRHWVYLWLAEHPTSQPSGLSKVGENADARRSDTHCRKAPAAMERGEPQVALAVGSSLPRESTRFWPADGIDIYVRRCRCVLRFTQLTLRHA